MDSRANKESSLHHLLHANYTIITRGLSLESGRALAAQGAPSGRWRIVPLLWAVTVSLPLGHAVAPVVLGVAQRAQLPGPVGRWREARDAVSLARGGKWVASVLAQPGGEVALALQGCRLAQARSAGEAGGVLCRVGPSKRRLLYREDPVGQGAPAPGEAHLCALGDCTLIGRPECLESQRIAIRAILLPSR